MTCQEEHDIKGGVLLGDMQKHKVIEAKEGPSIIAVPAPSKKYAHKRLRRTSSHNKRVESFSGSCVRAVSQMYASVFDIRAFRRSPQLPQPDELSMSHFLIEICGHFVYLGKLQ
jgi:hypothetical protein